MTYMKFAKYECVTNLNAATPSDLSAPCVNSANTAPVTNKASPAANRIGDLFFHWLGSTMVSLSY